MKKILALLFFLTITKPIYSIEFDWLKTTVLISGTTLCLYGIFDFFKNKLLEWAVENNKVKTTKAILYLGGNPNIKVTRCKLWLPMAIEPIICKAILQRNSTIVESLLKYGANPNTEGHLGTIMQVATFSENKKIVELLLKYGANPNITPSWNKQTPLFSTSNLEIIRVLIKNGANVHAKTFKGETLLHGAAKFYDPELALFYLKECGLNPNATNSNGKTPLHFIRYKDYNKYGEIENNKILKTQMYFFKFGANPDIASNNSKLPLHLAAYYNAKKAIPYQLFFSSNHQQLIKQKNNNNKTAFDLTTNPEIKKLLSNENEQIKAINTVGKKLLAQNPEPVQHSIMKRELGSIRKMPCMIQK